MEGQNYNPQRTGGQRIGGDDGILPVQRSEKDILDSAKKFLRVSKLWESSQVLYLFSEEAIEEAYGLIAERRAHGEGNYSEDQVDGTSHTNPHRVC